METHAVYNEDDLRTVFRSAARVLQKEGQVSIAFSSEGMDCKVFSLRGLSQNALFHIWLREAAKFTFKSKVSDIELESMKRYCKMRCYSDTKQSFLVQTLINPQTKQRKTDLTSSGNWTKGEMTFFLDWMQSFFAEEGLLLEAQGDYLEYSGSQNQ
jgi:ubiquinone/menaquinone biosynthesis C-methylase UbiE|tara:strand:+ start:7103 stop:7570 length:468 start_codon:yes stop_codon:yes gene_type:complete